MVISAQGRHIPIVPPMGDLNVHFPCVTTIRRIESQPPRLAQMHFHPGMTCLRSTHFTPIPRVNVPTDISGGNFHQSTKGNHRMSQVLTDFATQKRRPPRRLAPPPNEPGPPIAGNPSILHTPAEPCPFLPPSHQRPSPDRTQPNLQEERPF